MKGKLNRKQLLVISILLIMVVLIVVLPKILKKDNNINLSETNAMTNGLKENVQDGVVLHVFNWSYNTIRENMSDIAKSGYSAVQTSPVQTPEGFDKSKSNVEEVWEKLYHPSDCMIAEESWLGTSEELETLCREADKYGVKVIADIITDIDNADENLLELLKDCVNCGVDGFRFSNVKGNDKKLSADYLCNTVEEIEAYAKSNSGIDLYCYVELDDETERNKYAEHMSVIDDVTSEKVMLGIIHSNVKEIMQNEYYSNVSPDKTALMTENGYTYFNNVEESEEKGINTSIVSETNINKVWSLVASRKGATALYFARPGKAKMGEMGTTNWKDAAVAATNKFHNTYADNEEYISSTGDFVVNERYSDKGLSNNGIVIVNTTGKASEVKGVKVEKVVEGEYADYITGAVFTVKDGMINGQMGDTGIAVLFGDESKEEAASTKEKETTALVVSTEAPEGAVDFFFDASNCIWFTKDNAEPVLKADSGSFARMNKFKNSITGNILYHCKISPKTQKITIARMLADGKMTNAYTINYEKDYNLYKSKSDWTSGGVWSNYEGEVPDETDNTIIESSREETTHNYSTEESTTQQQEVQRPADTNPEVPKESEKSPVDTPNNEPASPPKNPSVNEKPPESTSEKATEETTQSITKENYIKIYFTNNKLWEDAYCYYWGGSQSNVEWPGTKMSFVKNNSMKQSIYCIEIPHDVEGIVFNNGKSNSALIQTNDIKSGIKSGIGYYISSDNTTGNRDVSTYIYK